MFKKNAIALAISAVVLAPTAASANTLYGFINVGLESTSIEGNGAKSEIFASGADGSLHGQDVAETRFGVKGSKELANGLTAGYRLEFGIGTSSGAAGGTVEDSGPTTRLAQVSLSGDFGTFTVGNQWGILYEYLGWNVYRSHGHGAGTWYWTTQGNFAPNTSNINNDAWGLRVSNAFTYTYGGGGYSSDPFTFSVQVMADPDGTPAGNDETFDAIVFGAGMNFGDLTVNAISYSESDSSGAEEPSLTGLGFRYNITSATYVGGNYMTVDDDEGNDISSLNVLLTHDLGNGLSGMVGIGSGDGDGKADLDSNLFLTLIKDYGEGVITYLEIESVKLSNGDETSIVAGNLKYSF